MSVQTKSLQQLVSMVYRNGQLIPRNSTAQEINDFNARTFTKNPEPTLQELVAQAYTRTHADLSSEISPTILGYMSDMVHFPPKYNNINDITKKMRISMNLLLDYMNRDYVGDFICQDFITQSQLPYFHNLPMHSHQTFNKLHKITSKVQAYNKLHNIEQYNHMNNLLNKREFI